MTDSRLTHFLKHFPAQYLLMALFVLVLIYYVNTQDQFFQRVMDTVLGALLGILTGRWTQPTQSANTESGDVNVMAETPLNGIEPKVEGLDLKGRE